MNNKKIITLENVNFSYPGSSELAVKNVTMTISRGDYIGIVGPNGAGKSTLVKLMLGLLRPKSGQISLFGTEISEFKNWYKIGYVPQRTYVEMNFPLTVGEMVMMGRYGKKGLFRFPDEHDKEIMMKSLSFVNMLGFQNRQVSSLSGGQEQRAIIARALACEPEMIFLDEPTVGVDVKTQKQFYQLLRKLNRELKLTLILVSHELDVVAHESTRLAYINRTLEYFGDPKEFIKGAYFHELIGVGGLHGDI